jgi:hypothetical protein
MRHDEREVCLRRQYRQILLGGSGSMRMSNELTGLLFLIETPECEVHGQSVNPWVRACRNFHTGNVRQYHGVRNFVAESCAG